MAKVKFFKSAKVEEGTSLQKAAKKTDVDLNIRCGKGKCGKCIVKVSGELNKVTDEEIKSLGQDKIDKGYRLACMVTVKGDAEIKLQK
jgi:ferredoxin